MSMCRVESYKAFEEAELIYEKHLKENLIYILKFKWRN